MAYLWHKLVPDKNQNWLFLVHLGTDSFTWLAILAPRKEYTPSRHLIKMFLLVLTLKFWVLSATAMKRCDHGLSSTSVATEKSVTSVIDVIHGVKAQLRCIARCTQNKECTEAHYSEKGKANGKTNGTKCVRDPRYFLHNNLKCLISAGFSFS